MGRDGKDTVLLAPLMNEQALHWITLRAEGSIVLKKLPVGHHISDKVFVVDGSKDDFLNHLVGKLTVYKVRRF